MFLRAKTIRFWRIIPMCLCLVVPVVLSPSVAQANASKPSQLEEFQAKALLIYNIAKFVLWPEDAYQEQMNDFVIDIVGGNPFGGAFYFIHDKTIQGRMVQVFSELNLDDSPPCQVLYTDSINPSEFARQLPLLQKEHVLTITSNPSLFKAGATVLLSVEEDRLTFRVNLEAARAADLEISGNLLRHAEEVILAEHDGGHWP